MASETEATSTIRNPSIRGSTPGCDTACGTGCAISQTVTVNTAAAHNVRFIKNPSPLFPVMMTVRNRAREYIRVHHHQQPYQHHQTDAVLQHRAEQIAFLAHLPRDRARDYQRLGRDHLAHHAARA